MPNADRLSEDVLRTLERITQAEGLATSGEAIDFLVREYESFPEGYQGGHSMMVLDYRNHLAKAVESTLKGRIPVQRMVWDTFPNSFMYRGGAKFVPLFRREYSWYAARRLRALDEAFEKSLEAVVVGAGSTHGFKDESARGLASALVHGTRRRRFDDGLPLKASLRELCADDPTYRSEGMPRPEALLLEVLDSGRGRRATGC